MRDTQASISAKADTRRTCRFMIDTRANATDKVDVPRLPTALDKGANVWLKPTHGIDQIINA